MSGPADPWLLGAASTLALASIALGGLAVARERGAAAPLGLRRRAAIDRERHSAVHIPYTAHVDPYVIKTRSGDYVQAFRLAGGSFECTDDATLNQWHHRLNVLWRNLATDEVALWTHVVRRREQVYPEGECPPGFSRALDRRYRERVAGERLMVNELYLAVVVRPRGGAVSATAFGWLARASEANAAQAERDALEACEKLRTQLTTSLERYDPEPLGIYTRGGRAYSSLLEYLALIVNGEWQRMPVPRASIAEVLMTTRPFFGAESMEYRMAAHTRLAAMLGIKEYPTPTQPGMFNALLAADFPFVLTQSFAFLPKSTAQGLLTRQHHRLRNARDLAVSQADELEGALDALTSNEFCMGDHHFTLQVLADPFPGTREAEGAARLKQLLDHVSAARNLLADTGMVVAREDLALEGGFWAQLPGNFAFRPRKAPITSRNFAAMVPFHNYPAGRATGNHWGNALTMLVTSARSPYYFSLHASDPREADGGSRRDTGHTALIGPTGSGKTVLIAFLVGMLRKTGATQLLFDKDRGLEILVRAEGGQYLALRNGQPTGMNPLQLEPTPANLEFLKAWLRSLVVRTDRPFSVREDADLDLALKRVLTLPCEARRLSRLLEYLDPTDSEGVYARLARWCGEGDYAWVFDHREDRIAGLVGETVLAGFDVTDFLDNATTRTPVTMYLFHVVRSRLDGQRLVVWMDEFAKLLDDPAFEAFAKDGLKTWRKLEGVAAFAAQSASDVLASAIARTLVEQTATKIFFPNPDADEHEYREGFGLSEQELRLVKHDLEPGSRSFLVKQGHQSVVCALDLHGFDAELAVMSGRAQNVTLLHRLMDELGPEPDAWLPRFCELAVAGSPDVRATP
ncbi:MAG: VirB4 family type IV secretion/conjugal transfer ATPase [Burkholderiales bacterium]|jgi:type IV secretion system protein VirB4|nr:VirB4 family type IV secretion/conjugal transfer ATPase [Burkholderiales bacterium]